MAIIFFFAFSPAVVFAMSERNKQPFFSAMERLVDDLSSDSNIIIVSFKSSVTRLYEINKNMIQELGPDQEAPKGKKVIKRINTMRYGSRENGKRVTHFKIDGQFKLLEKIQESGILPDFKKKTCRDIDKVSTPWRYTRLGQRLYPIFKRQTVNTVYFLAISGRENKDDIMSYSFFGPLEKEDFKPIAKMAKEVLEYKKSPNDDMLKKFLLSNDPYLAYCGLLISIKEKKKFVNLIFDSKLLYNQEYGARILDKIYLYYLFENKTRVGELRKFLIEKLPKSNKNIQKKLLEAMIKRLKSSNNHIIDKFCRSEGFLTALRSLAKNQKDEALKSLYEKLAEAVAKISLKSTK